jgi:hypothetical protein
MCICWIQKKIVDSTEQKLVTKRLSVYKQIQNY